LNDRHFGSTRRILSLSLASYILLEEDTSMSSVSKSIACMVAGFAVMMAAYFYIGETPMGWATVLAGFGVYYYGWRGICPACQAGRCPNNRGQL
jgi:hypothetical protein